MSSPASKRQRRISRRGFLKASAAAAAAGAFGVGCAAPAVQRRGPIVMPSGGSPDRIRVGLIGCGGRGVGAARDCVKAAEGVEIVALGDLFLHRIEEAREKLADLGEAFRVTEQRCFTGFDNYEGVLGCDIDLVILATPPGFRPTHLKAAVDAGRHVFMEKPVGVDPVGIRSVLESSDRAAAKGLAIVAGTQRRHQPHYIEAMRRIHAGEIGEVVAAQCYWNQVGLWVVKREPGWSDMEWQCRNWLYFTWLSGDHIVEQHVHNIDTVNWALRAVPVKCVGMGGRQSRTAPEFGNIYDHFSVEFEYPGGVRVLSMCRQVDGTSERIAERFVGTRGVAYTTHSTATIKAGRKEWQFDDGGKPVNPYIQEHADLIQSIRAGAPLNEGRQVAESTLAAIMGRMSAYTGREVSWNWVLNSSQLDLMPQRLEFGDNPVDPVAVPGTTRLV